MIKINKLGISLTISLISLVTLLTACGGGGGGAAAPSITDAQVKAAVAELDGLRIDSISSLEALLPAE